MIPHVNSRTFGHGSRRALAIHCTLAHSGAWRGVGTVLEDMLTMRAFDLPCHGKSGDWDGQGNVHDVATEMARSLLTEKMDLIGHSFGATVALRLAVESPDLVRSVTLIEPVYYAPVLVDEPQRVAAFAERNAPFDAAMASGDMMEAARAFNRGWGDGTPWAELPEALRDYMAKRIHFVAASTAFIRDDSAGLMNRLGEATMPALLMQGSTSPDMSDAINAALARRLPDTRRVSIDGAGHMAPITHPAEVAGAIVGFLEAA